MLCEGFWKYIVVEIVEKLDYYGVWFELFSLVEYVYIILYLLNKYFVEMFDVFELIIKEFFFLEKELGMVIDVNI